MSPAKKKATKKKAAKKKATKKSTTKRTSTKTTKKKRGSAMSSKLRVRMYNVGFGDSFLVWVPASDGSTRKILFDCGTMKQANRDIATIAQAVVDDAKDPDGVSRVDVVVATHRHKDHVAGFKEVVWAGLEVKEVWMPWTEDPTDPVARHIRETQAGVAARLVQGINTRLAGLAAGAERTRLELFQDMAINALSNEEAMDTLHRGFTGNPTRRFMPTKVASDATFTTPALPGITIHVLGPSRKESVIQDMDPPSSQSYLARFDRDLTKDLEVPQPFKPRWWRTEQDPEHAALPQADKDRVKALGEDAFDALAATLENAVNGTSLMLVLEIGSKCFLFPGDAQWGTWEAAMAVPAWEALLKRTSFYKIGHHGSHNATPKSFVETLLPDDFYAMASATKFGNWKIPREPLMTALLGKSPHVARTDKLPAVPAGFTANAQDSVDVELDV